MSTMDEDNLGTGRGRKRGTAGERLLRTADDLFYRRGIRAVGVDQIVKEAGVAKISLYRAYPSKDDLIADYLRDRDAAFWRAWDEAVEDARRPADQLRAAIALLRDAMDDPTYRGCPFANFVAEFPERDHPGRAIVEASKSELRRRLAGLCHDIDAPDPRRLADGLFLLIEGAFAASQTAGSDAMFAGDALGWTVETLLHLTPVQEWQVGSP